MEYVKNQKGIKSLKMNETIWNSITSDENEVIVGFGSNGRGKSTLKELFRKQNLKKNFSLENEEQINMIFDVFGNYDYLIYDEEFINGFVFSNDGLKRNQSKIIMNTVEIENKINEKNSTNEVIHNILEKCNAIINNSTIIDKTLDIKLTGNVTAAKKRFATTFIHGNFPYAYDTLFDFDDKNHKNWWYEGLLYYKNKNLNYCPWCKSSLENFNNNIREQVENIDSVSEIDDKLFSDKRNKINNLSQIKESFQLGDNTIDKINEIISLIESSIENDNEQVIINLMKELRTSFEGDVMILKEIVSKVKYINNIFEIERTDLTNRINELTFFSVNSEEFISLSQKINEFITYNNSVIESINRSNNELGEIISSSEEEINICLHTLGLQYKIEIDKNQIIENGINNDSPYIILKSLNNIDVSESIAETLSYGEKSTLAFAIFLQQIKVKSTNNTIIILDDPISSYDIFRRYTSIDLLRMLKDISYKKMILLTHESNFMVSVITNLKNYVKPLILSETNDGEITIDNLNYQYEAEVNYYKNILLNIGNYFTISQRILAFRQLHDLFKFISGTNDNLAIYNYLCKLLHYRKDEKEYWDDNYIADLQKIFDYFGLSYDSSIELMKDENFVFDDIENLYTNIINKSVYDIKIEELCCLRMISEYAIRMDSQKDNRFKKSNQTMWKLNDSQKMKRLENYRALLNSITHIDDDEIAWPTLCLNDFKAIPKVVINQIINIIK